MCQSKFLASYRFRRLGIYSVTDSFHDTSIMCFLVLDKRAAIAMRLWVSNDRSFILMRTTSLKSTNQGELLNYVSHANKEHYSASLNSITHSLSHTHIHKSKQASISPGCLRRWRPQPEEDVWSRKGIQKDVFLTLASTEPWTLCFNNPVSTRNRERHTVDGGGRTFPNHFDVPLMSTD